MWLGAFPTLSVTVDSVISLAFVVSAMVLSVLAFARETGPQYDQKGSRVGVLVVILGVLLYVTGTYQQSALFHSVSIALFYWGSVFYLGGTRTLVSTLPAGFMALSVLVTAGYPPWGAFYLYGVSWALGVASAAILFAGRKVAQPLGCGLCASFRSRGRTFCSSCGSLLERPSTSLGRRRVLGFALFTAIFLTVLGLTVPVTVAGPRVALVDFGLGGPHLGSFAPLDAWRVAPIASAAGGAATGYSLTQGGASLQAYVATSQSSGVALSAVNSTMTAPIAVKGAPATVSPSMQAYTFIQGKTRYVGLQGVFGVGFVNGTSIGNTYLGVNLRETAAAFSEDNGSALYAAASSMASWASGWAIWSSTVGAADTLYLTLSQVAYVCSISAIGVVLFTVARDDELAKVRRVEALRGIGSQEVSILSAFGHEPQQLLGDQLLGATRKLVPTITDQEFYSSLDELSRRGLVSPNVVIRKTLPVMLWKCLV